MQTILSKVIVAISFLLSSLSITATTDPFSFTSVIDAQPNTLISSNIATISGFDSTVSIRIEGGSYTIGASTPTAAEGVISLGVTVAVQVLSSSEFNTQAIATLTLGSGTSTTRAIFSVTTRASPNAPVFTSTPTITTRASSLYRYDLSARDIDSSDLIFSAASRTTLPSWLAIDAVVTTLAGSGVAGKDDGATSTADFRFPTNVAIDAVGNIIVADRDNHRIRKIAPGGLVTTVAGSGVADFADGASATAQFDRPVSVAIDASGNIIVVDQRNHRIRNITPGGTVSTIAGSGTFGFADGASTTALFDSPTGVAIDALGNIIIADSFNHRIRNIVPGGTVTTIAGTGLISFTGNNGFADGASATARFSNPLGITIDAVGNIIVADSRNYRIRIITSDGTVSTIAGSSQGFDDGASATAKFAFPTDVTIDAAGNIIVADSGNHRIRSIDVDGIVSTIAGSIQGFADGVVSTAKFDTPGGLAIDNNDIIIVDERNHRIRKINRNDFALVGVPSCDDIGTYNLELIVSDGEFQDLQSFDIVVADDGSCGRIPTNLALSTTTIFENIATNSIIATISADDSDNPASLTFSIVGGADSASFSISSGNQLVIDHSPDFEAQNSYEIIISVSDIIHQLTKTFGISVNDVNDVSPVFTSIPITNTMANSLYQYNLSASDVDSTDLIFSAASGTTLPSWLAIDLVVTTLAGDGVAGDNNGASATARFSSPSGVAIDALGNTIVADTINHLIRNISPQGVVTTIAGGGGVGFGFDDGASATAQFIFPNGVAIDASGDIIVADTSSNRIRRITPNGIVSTIAGSSTSAFVDGASATARFSAPFGVAIDALGNIIVADRNNNRIRKITPGGTVSTIAGSGDAGSTDGASLTAKFNAPTGVAIDALGNIIVADRNNNRIRKITLGGTVTTIAGGDAGSTDGASTTAKFDAPTGVAIDALGNIIVADGDNHRIRKITPDEIVSTIAGSSSDFADGASATARFSSPLGVAVDALGNIIIADKNNNRIRKIERSGLAGTPSCNDVGIYELELIVSDGKLQGSQSFNIIVANDGSCGDIPTNLALSTTTIFENIATNSIIATISADDSDNPGSLTFSIVGGPDSPSFSISGGNQLVIDHSPDFEVQNSYEIIISVSDIIHQLTKTFGISVNDVNEVSPVFTSTPITTTMANSLYQYNLGATDVDSSSFTFSAAPRAELPSWLAIDLVITTLAGDGVSGDNNGTSLTARFNNPSGVAIDALGNIIVADTANHRIRNISPQGIVSTIAGSTSGFVDGASDTARFASPTGVAIDVSGDIIVADRNNNRIRRITPNGRVSTIAGSTLGFVDGASATAKFSTPVAVTIDALGNIIVADRDNNRIRKITPGGTVSTIAGSTLGFDDGTGTMARFSFPSGIAIDALGNIIVADRSNNRIRKITPDEIVSTIAGSRTSGFADGASPTARFSAPIAVTIDALGNIIVADRDNHRIRKITPDETVSTIAGSETGFVDGASTIARFSIPTGVAIDALGNIIVADKGNHSIRKIGSILLGTPSCNDIGIYDLELIVSDGMLTSSQSFDIIVADDGSCGFIPTNLALSTTTIFENIATNSIIATISADDSNNPGVLSFSIVGGRDSASFSIISGNQLVIDHSPDFETQNSYEIIIAVSDVIHQLTKTFRIGVNNVNEFSPVFTSTPPITTTRANSLYQYNLSVTDVDSSNLVVSAASVTIFPSWLAIGAVVTTLAGDGVAGDNDGASNTARFNFPRSVAIDASGNIIVADSNRIRSVSLDGIVTTIAGSSTSGFADGPSPTARFYSPNGVAINANGDIIVADTSNHRIRGITPDGIVFPIAGVATTTITGNFVDGASNTARFNVPEAIAIDASGNIIVADQFNSRIRSISADGMVTTVAGSGTRDFADGASNTARFSFPVAVAIDASGNIIVADNRRIRKITPGGTVTTIAGSGIQGSDDGASATARFRFPRGVAIDASGNIIVADSNRIRSIITSSVVTTIAGISTAGFADGVADNAQFSSLNGVAIDASGNIIVADVGNHRIRKIDRNPSLVGTASCGDIGIHNLELIVSDGDFQDLQSFDIVVLDDGSCGTIPANLALSTTTIFENIATNSIIAIISADDSDNPASLTFSIVGGADSPSFSISGGNQLIIDHSPDFETQNSYEIIIGVSDIIHPLVTKTFSIGVNNVNEFSPVFTSSPITSARVSGLYQYSLSASDVDSSNLVFNPASGTILPNWLAIDIAVTTLAGDGLADDDNGATSTASFNAPSGVAIDAFGDIIVADRDNHRIRKITSNGVVTTIAGGQFGFADGASSTAEFRSPTGVTIDANGNIIVADRDNHRIRKITPDGMVNTIAGSSDGFADGTSTMAGFSFPSGVAIDANSNIIVADSNNNRIRSIDPDDVVSTIAGSETGFADGTSTMARFSFPSGVAIDASGNIVVADRDNHRIRSISSSGVVTTIAGSDTGFADGASSTAEFRSPAAVAIDGLGNIIVGDSSNHRIRTIATDQVVRTVAGSSFGSADGGIATAKFNSPAAVAIDSGGNIIVADRGNNRIRKIDRNNLIGTPLNCSDIGIYDLELIVSDGELQDLQSFDIVVLDDGSCGAIPANLALSTTTIVENTLANSIIATISADDSDNSGSLTFSIIGGPDSPSFSISGGNQLIIDHSPDFEAQNSYEIIIGASDIIHPLVTKTFSIGVNDVNEVSPVFISTPITSTIVGSLYQYGLSASDTDSSNFVFSAASETQLPSWLVISAVVTTLAGDGSRDGDDGATSTASFDLPRSVAIDASGNIIVADANNHRIRSISIEGVVRTIAGSSTSGFVNGASTTARFNSPRDVAIDALGNIIVADRGNHSIRKITPDGMVSTIAGSNTGSFVNGASATARFRSPTGVAIDALGNIIVTDQNNHRIRSITSDGTVTTITGSGMGSVDGASATAEFNRPWGVTIDALGNIIVADSRNNRIRSISADGIVRTIAGSNTVGTADGASATARFNNPTGVAVDAGGNIIVADSSNNRIRSIAPDGVVSTVAGSDTGSTDGLSSDAKFFRPVGVAIDASDNIIIADQSNSRIRKIDRNNLIGTPSCDDIGIHNLALIVSDGELQSSQSFTIRVMSDGSCVLVAPFSFDVVNDVALGATITSGAITIATNTQDPQSTFTISIEGSDARYSINDGSYTDLSGVVNIGDSVRVQIVASNQLNTTKTATISIDNITAAFTITTTNLMIIGGDSTASYNDPPITISATSSDITTIAITWTSSATSVVSFSDPNIGLITIVGAGSALITARRGGNEDSIIFTVEPLTLTPTFASPQTFIYNTNIRTVLATITSGIVGTDDVSLSTSGATATDVGNYNIALVLIGTASRNYRLSTTTLSWSIIKADQSQFSLGADTTITFGDSLSRPAIGVSATVASSYGSSNPDVATVATNGDITTTGVGSTIISTTNTGDNNYNSAADSYTLNVAPLTLTIATGSTTTIYTGAAIIVTTTITNLVSGYEQVSLTISGSQTATNTGDYSFDISAIEGSDSPNYILIPITISWVVAPARQSELDITSNATRLMVGQTTIATATNDQPQGTLTISASEAGIVTIDGSTITANNVGITTITISKQVANHNDISVSYQLVVIQNTTTPIDAGDDRTTTYAPSGVLSAQTPTNTQSRVISYAIDPIDSDVATININTGAITITNAGTVSIIVSAAATTNYASSTDNYLLTINQANQEPFTITTSGTLILGATSAIVVVEFGSGDGTITYSSSDIAIATITTDGIITATGAGEATITATKAGGRNYNDISTSASLEVVMVTGFNLDIDDDGRRLTTTDGILIIRFLTGSTDTIDTTGATTSDAQRNTQQILKFLQSGYDRLDVDGNGTIEANSDGMLIMRYLADQENLNTAGATTTTSIGANIIIINLQNIYK